MEAYKDLERSFKEIEQGGFDSLKNRDGRMWKEWNQKKNKRIAEYRVDGTNYRVYLTENSDDWIFRLFSPKSQQTANLKSFKKDKFSVNQAIHVFDCIHH